MTLLDGSRRYFKKIDGKWYKPYKIKKVINEDGSEGDQIVWPVPGSGPVTDADGTEYKPEDYEVSEEQMARWRKLNKGCGGIEVSQDVHDILAGAGNWLGSNEEVTEIMEAYANGEISDQQVLDLIVSAVLAYIGVKALKKMVNKLEKAKKHRDELEKAKQELEDAKKKARKDLDDGLKGSKKTNGESDTDLGIDWDNLTDEQRKIYNQGKDAARAKVNSAKKRAEDLRRKLDAETDPARRAALENDIKQCELDQDVESWGRGAVRVREAAKKASEDAGK